MYRILDTLTTVLDTHEVYFYLIQNYNNPPALLKEIWSVPGVAIMRAGSDRVDSSSDYPGARRLSCSLQ